MIHLPIDQHLDEIVNKALGAQPLVLSASPGSGKTTRVPSTLLKHLQQQKNLKKIVVIIPKRISVLSAASRIAEENQWTLGNEVGYAVRFDSQLQNHTQLIFMTDGMFLKKYHDSNFMRQIGFIILDEFHERKSNIDLILGLAFEQKVLHNNLQIIVMSATINLELLKKYFGEVEVLQIQAPPYKTETIYLNSNQRLVCDQTFFEQLKTTTLEAWKKSQKDILIFLPGLREIRRAQETLQPRFPQTSIDILHGSLSLAIQKNVVFKNHSERRMILATNIAESSITVPDLDCVIDSGLEKTVEVEKKIGFSRLKTERISLFSAVQREGRAARTQNGFCFKLWHPVDERSMPAAIEPEILNSTLHHELLFLSSVGVRDFINFSWLTPPPLLQIKNTVSELLRWNLIDEKFQITVRGQQVVSSPINIYNSILLLELITYFEGDLVCDLVTRLEDLETRSTATGHYKDDIQRLLDTPLSETQKKLKKSLQQFISKFKSQPQVHTESISVVLFKIFSHYFPQRIIAQKNAAQGLSSTGRGVELESLSCARHFDFYAALAGEEKSDALTSVSYGVGVSKAEALRLLSAEAQYENRIFFDEKTETFFKQEALFFGAFKLNEKSKERLDSTDLNRAWKKYALEAPETFLKLNPTYKSIMIKLSFLQSKGLVTLEDFNLKLVQKLSQVVETFEDFKNCDLIYYLDEIELLQQLPSSLKLPSGRLVEVNYEDPKAPMISSKIQDFFGWNEAPQILGFKVTLEMLAPNRRPAQTTSDLAYFWKHSYLDVRKDLRARYPKHAWPEDPTTFQPESK